MKVARLTSLFILGYFISLNVYCQKQTTVTYQYKDALLEDSFYFDIIKPISVYPDKHLPYYKCKVVSFKKDKQGLYTTVCKYDIADTTLGLIADFYGHEMCLIPGGDMTIFVTKMEKVNDEYLLNNKFKSTWSYNFNIKGKHKEVYEFFDSLAFHAGPVFMDFIHYNQNSPLLSKYYDSMLNKYNAQNEYAKYYFKKYKLPLLFQRLALGEIKSAFVAHLLEPLMGFVKGYKREDYPDGYLSMLDSFDVNNGELFFNCLTYRNTVIEYIRLYKTKFLMNPIGRDKRFAETFNNIAKINASPKAKNYLAATFFLQDINRGYLVYDSLFNEYKNAFPKSIYIAYIDSIRKSIISPPKKLSTGILASKVTDKDGNSFIIKDILKGKVIVIDCWASWCMPCIKEIPASLEFEKKYKDKVQFVFLSFDKNKEDWLAKNNVFNLPATSYLIADNFKSVFAKQFNIASIPRYIIIDNEGNVFNFSSKRPSKKEAFAEMLDGFVGK